MGRPLIYVGFHRVKEGKLQDAREASRDLVEFLKERHPRLAHFEIGFSPEGDEMRVVQVHPDEESMALHMELSREKIAGAYGFLEKTTRILIFGDPTDAFTRQIEGMATAFGAPVTITRPETQLSRLSAVSV